MADKELLEYAAKAAGIDAEFHAEIGYSHEGMWLKGARSPDNSKYWNPLTDDGDALRLFCKLPWMCIETSDVGVTVRERGEKCERVYFKCTEWLTDHNGDIYAATRRAIVRAAAEIGKAMI